MEVSNTTEYRILACEQKELGGKTPKGKGMDNSIEVITAQENNKLTVYSSAKIKKWKKYF